MSLIKDVLSAGQPIQNVTDAAALKAATDAVAANVAISEATLKAATDQVAATLATTSAAALAVANQVAANVVTSQDTLKAATDAVAATVSATSAALQATQNSIDQKTPPLVGGASPVQVAQLPTTLTPGGGLKVAIIEALPIDIGIVDQGAPGALPWRVTDAAAENALAGIKGDTTKLDVPLSGRASETTLAAIHDRQADGTQRAHVDNFPAFPASQAVTGPLTNTELRAAAVPVSQSSQPLPAGAATETTLAAVLSSLATRALDATVASSNTILSSILSGLASIFTRQADGTQKTQVTALPALPAGGSTIGKVDQGLAGASAWLTDVSDRAARLLGVLSTGTNVIGKVGLDAANLAGVALDATVVAVRDRLPAALVGGRLDANNGAWMGSTAPTVGQKTMAASLPVTIASDQPAVPQAPPASFSHIINTGTTVCKAAAGTLRGFSVNAPGTKSTATINIDGVALAIPTTVGQVYFPYSKSFAASLQVVTAIGAGGGPADLTVFFD